ncbi:helix-turn-helix transcriptional regulator [Enterococcus durans]|uniref:Helix-turn-helix transcriptional regulator n=1 Tax=Enterococcus durans TaxID=53345 RepID=A0A5N0YYL1_9ENTE|nr:MULTISPECIES: helix-turn-helix transcriptional regulator [Enterococcus]EGP4742925.1 helix-turn-helix transcriptional regulator [Enterococcus faecium]EGP5538481.1 XRE family transcriptional regulator [Enterococcus faecium]EGP5669565.1 XRE family transcriptional regulator [Enterococcus faecium]EME8107033.1 helix-turn-helix transcriptional regulator [Enterococcus faecium]KAA9181093.1 helix-turn-helix transcriptional regulator [Enterococcus durans]
MNRIKELRKEKKMTLIDLSNELNIPKSTLSRYENGDSEPKKDTLEKIANYFEVSVAYLLGASIYRTEINEKYLNTVDPFFDILMGLISDSENKISGSITDTLIRLSLAWMEVVDESSDGTACIAKDFAYASRIVSGIFIGDYSINSNHTELNPEEKKEQYYKDRKKLIKILDKYAFREIELFNETRD